MALTFVEQLVVPWLMLVPDRRARILGGVTEISFQLLIVATGNYAWINVIGAVPCFALLDDDFLAAFGGTCIGARRRLRGVDDVEGKPGAGFRHCVRLAGGGLYRVAVWALLVVMLYKSMDPVKELFSPAPWINNYDE